MAILYTTYRLNPADTGYVVQQDHYDGGSVQETMVPVSGAPAAVVNFNSLVSKAQAAITANQTFLAIGSPTQAQAVAQVQALTRQMDAVIYYLLQELTGLSTIPGT